MTCNCHTCIECEIGFIACSSHAGCLCHSLTLHCSSSFQGFKFKLIGPPSAQEVIDACAKDAVRYTLRACLLHQNRHHCCVVVTVFCCLQCSWTACLEPQSINPPDFSCFRCPLPQKSPPLPFQSFPPLHSFCLKA